MRGYCELCGGELTDREKMLGLLHHVDCKRAAVQPSEKDLVDDTPFQKAEDTPGGSASGPSGAPPVSPFFCFRCGVQLPKSSLYCPQCGTRQPLTEAQRRAPVPQAVRGALPQDAPRAGWWTRWVGYAIIDQIVVYAIMFVVGLIVTLIYYAGAEYTTEQEEEALTGLLGLVYLLISFLYFWVANSLGRSVGKLVLGLRIVTKYEGTAPGWGRGFVRTIGYVVSTLPVALGFLWAAWDKDRQAWHDKMADTIVIKARS